MCRSNLTRIMCFSNEDVKLFDNLLWPLELGNLDKSLWNDKCDYVDLEKCKNLNMNNWNLIVLQLNICSMLSHKSELKDLLHKLEQNSPVDIILQCETFLNNKMQKLFNLPNFTLVANNHTVKKGGGTAILILKSIQFTR